MPRATQTQTDDIEEAGMHSVTVKLPDEVYQRIRRDAYERDCSKSEAVRSLLLEALQALDAKR